MGVKKTNGKVTKKSDKYMDKWINKASNSKEISKPCADPPTSNEEKTIDIEVLNSLPEDMRHQVIEEYKSLGYKIPSCNQFNSSPQAGPSNIDLSPQAGPSNIDLSPQAGPSNIGLLDENEILEVQIENAVEDLGEISRTTAVPKNLADISYSQIDESFLNALPNDIKNDLQKDFERLKNQKEKSSKTNNFHKLLNPAPSISLKKKRGRRRGVQNKALIESHKRPTSDFVREMDRNAQKNDTHRKTGSGYIIDQVEPSTSPNSEPNLCGEKELNSIKSLISQWISSCETPTDIDISILTTFCLSLITEKDLEKLELVLMFIRRKVMCGSLKWRDAFDFILEAVQCKMIECYEAPLGGFPVQSRENLSV